ncbi:MAG: hypothetical protein Kow0075_16130 [Salibacteraceae bacterium]
MKISLTLAALVVFSQTLWAQVDEQNFKADLEKLYQSAKFGFKDIKGEAETTTPDGTKVYKANFVLSGAKNAVVKTDAENVSTYVATIELKNVNNPSAKLEEMVNWMLAALEKYGLTRGSGTDINYVGYRKHTAEYPSDNIDELGKHPSFSLGILSDGNPMVIELIVYEPLWK